MPHGRHVRLPTHRRGHFWARVQGWLPARAGSPLAGQDSHPLDVHRKFHEGIASSSPTDRALPGRTDFPDPPNLLTTGSGALRVASTLLSSIRWARRTRKKIESKTHQSADSDQAAHTLA